MSPRIERARTTSTVPRSPATSPAQYPAGSGVGVSVLLRQPHGFEGLAPRCESKRAPERPSRLAAVTVWPHRLLDRAPLPCVPAMRTTRRRRRSPESADVERTPIARRREAPRTVIPPRADAVVAAKGRSFCLRGHRRELDVLGRSSATSDSRSPELIASNAASANARSPRSPATSPTPTAPRLRGLPCGRGSCRYARSALLGA